MITFEQVTKIEALRRQIENLQQALTNDAKAIVFAIADDVGSKRMWIEQKADVTPLLRETLCKFTVAKIIKLLDESEHLGVDVTEPKKTLLEFLEEIKPKQEITP